MKVYMPEEIYERIRVLVANYYPHECGGIFVGRIETDDATIEQTMIPDHFDSSPVLFRRIARFFNHWLNKIFRQSNGETIYIGEWHSHPDGVPFPSSTDFKAMQSIALGGKVRIQTPLLMIVGYKPPAAYNEKFYVYSKNKLLPYEEE